MLSHSADSGRDHGLEVRRYAKTILAEWRATPTWRPGNQLREASFASSQEYAGRFLLELLQNAHDAHPADLGGGRVHVLLDEAEGPFGTLYVANAGRPFGWSEVESVCKYAQSTKPIGQGIGNKGIGFRSMLEITTNPEIYSASTAADGPAVLDGYRFRFAAEGDLRDLLGDAQEAHRAARDLPPFQVPIPIAQTPDACSSLAAEGMVTVIRLPLRTQAAAESAARRVGELVAVKAPVMLFLQRLGQLVVEQRSADGMVDRTMLTRQEHPTPGSPPDTAISMVEVDLGSQGRFVIARHEVAADRVRAAVGSATDDDRLGEAWRDWAGEQTAVVEVALPVGAESLVRGQVYTYLPLGEKVAAPLRAHVSVPFFTKNDRTDLLRDHPLNALLYQTLAEACLLAAEQLHGSDGEQARAMAVDMVAWDTDAHATELLAAAAQRLYGRSLADLTVIPCLTPDGVGTQWRSPREAVRWPNGQWVVLTVGAAAGVGVPVADPALGSDRLRRLARTCDAHRQRLEPTPSQLAELVEQIVAALPPPQPGLSGGWLQLYPDVARMFQEHGEVLRDRKILLGDDGILKPCNSASAGKQEAFFAPGHGAVGVPADRAVPTLLRKRLFYLHSELLWTDPPGQTLNQQARLFLEGNNLVRRFDAAGLLEHVGRALTASEAKALRHQALRFVFRLHRASAGGKALNVAGVGLYVPSAGGSLIAASTAVFGAGWSGTCGADLAAVVAEGRATSSDLRWIAERMIAPPQEFLARGESPEEWRGFLHALGVTDGLIPISTTGAATTAQGRYLCDAFLITISKATKEVAAQWRPYIARPSSRAVYPYTQYTATSAVRLPGQDAVGSFSESGRLAFARLVLHGLSHWENGRFHSVWSRWRDGSDPQQVITPLAAFVQGQPWLPVRGKERGIVFVRPTDAWHVGSGADEEPSFVATIARRIRPLLDKGRTLARLRAADLPIWGDPRDCARQIPALGGSLVSHDAGEDDRPALQRANESAWADLVARTLHDPEADHADLQGAHLLVERGGRLATVEIDRLCAGSERLYVADERAGMTLQLIREAGHPLLIVPGAATGAYRILERVCPQALRLVGDAHLAVRVDGATDLVGPDDLHELGRLLVDQLPWLPLAVAALADHAPRGTRPTDASLAEQARTMRSLRLHRYTSLEISLDGEPVALPDQHGGVLPLPGAFGWLILIPAALGGLDWQLVALLSRAIAHTAGIQESTSALMAAALHQSARHTALGQPADDQLGVALGLAPGQLDETARRLSTSVSGVLQRCYPVLIHVLGHDRAVDLLDPRPTDIRELHIRLDAVAEDLPLPLDKLIAAARDARDVDELREAVGLPFAAFNQTLAGLSPDYEPISRADAHEQAVRSHVDRNRASIVRRVRWAKLGEFDAVRPILGWIELIGLEWLTAPTAWALTMDAADSDMVQAHIETALIDRIGTPAPVTGPQLPSLDTVRSRNYSLVHRLGPDLVALVKAAGRPLLGAMADADPTARILADLHAAGALDFRELSDTDVISWLAALDQWPTGMLQTADPGAHKLTGSDVDRERRQNERDRQERASRHRIITFADHDFDIEPGDYTALVAELQSVYNLDPDLVGGRNRFATPYPPDTARARQEQGAGSIGKEVLSVAQRTAIGFIGEWFAYQWLLKRYPAIDSSSWVSTNCRSVYPGPAGDDTLGFDFRVGTGKTPLMFEVKATQRDGGQIELGESEVRAAHRFAGTDRWRILTVTNVLDPGNLAVTMLPNPFSARGQHAYRQDGGTLRFSYRL